MSDNLFEMVEAAFDRAALKRICEMPEDTFGLYYGMDRVLVDQVGPEDFYFFRDNGSDILAVAHLDTVVRHAQRLCNFIETAAGPVVYSGALDDRLGAYIILELLPALGVTYDILLTVGEESGQSTASFFDPAEHHDREYNWMIEFDRGGTDVVLYQYEDTASMDLVHECGAKVGDGIFSDISYMEHLGIKGFNWGVGYRDYHGPRSHAYLDDTMMMVAYYLLFHEANAETRLPHERRATSGWWGRSYRYDDDRTYCAACGSNMLDSATDWCENCGTCNTCWCDAIEDKCECSWAVADREAKERAAAIEEIEDVWCEEVSQ